MPKQQINFLVITRYADFVKYIKEIGLIGENDYIVTERATPNNCHDRHVIGVIPLWLAEQAKSVTNIRFRVPPELRGESLTLVQLRKYATRPVTYFVESEEDYNFED